MIKNKIYKEFRTTFKGYNDILFVRFFVRFAKYLKFLTAKKAVQTI